MPKVSKSYFKLTALLHLVVASLLLGGVVRSAPANCLISSLKRPEACLECIEGYRVDESSNLCVACPDFCKKCTADGCVTLRDNHYFTADGTVAPCQPEGCEECGFDDENKMTCHACKDGLGLVLKEEEGGKYSYICKKCADENCTKCDESVNRCGACKEGFKLDSGKCVATNEKICLNRNYDGACKDCPEGQKYSVYEKKCVHCPPSCSECAKENDCLYCDYGFTLSEDSSRCIRCSIEGCKLCHDGPYKCEGCAAGLYYDIRSKQCRPCHETCYECEGPSSDNCKVCKPGFRPQSIIVGQMSDEETEEFYKEINEVSGGKLEDYKHYV